MSRPDQADDLLAALRAARPAPGYQPSPTSPQATALLAAIMTGHAEPARAPRQTPRRLVLAGVPALAAAAAVAAVVTSAGSPRPASPLPAAASVRTAVLDAFDQAGGDIVATTSTIPGARGSWHLQSWAYPLAPRPGQQARLRELESRRGARVTDELMTYTEPSRAGKIPGDNRVLIVSYANRAWYEGPTDVVVEAGLTRASIRAQLARGGFTVAGRQAVQGHDALKLTLAVPGGTTASRGKAGEWLVLWVDARSYELLQSAIATSTPEGKLGLHPPVTYYHYLPATKANLALLTPPIPAGFTRTRQPPH